MLKNFEKGFKEDFRVKLTPGKLKTFCEIDGPAFGVGWPSEGSLDKVIVNRVFEVVVGEPGHSDQFSYIDCWAGCGLQLALVAKAPSRVSI
jgi:hypothetical protein